MRRVILAAIAAATVLVASPSQAQNVGPGKFIYDVAEISVPSLIDYTTATSSSGCAVGVHGCLVSSTFSGVTSVNVTGPDADLATMPYSARVRIDLYDASANGTLVCTASFVEGFLANGIAHRESLGALSESGVNSPSAWARIDRVNATGCSGGAASDIFRVSVVGSEIGVPVALAGADDIISLHLAADSAESSWHAARTGYTIVGNGSAVAFGSATIEGTNVGSAWDTWRVLLRVKGRRFLAAGGGR